MNSSKNDHQNHERMEIPRAPAFAGQFYPGSKTALVKELNQLFAEAVPRKDKITRALLAPHAGYIYSGAVAASAFNQVDRGDGYDHVFVLASSHNYRFSGAAVFPANYETPIGEVQVDQDVVIDLLQSSRLMIHHRNAHLKEHSLEVLLPFIQHKLGDNIKLVPLVIGTGNPEDCRFIAQTLEPYFTPQNLFVVSTDFSHYPRYDDALRIDKFTAEAVAANNPDQLLQALDENQNEQVPDLATSMCGWTSVLTLLHLTKNLNLDYHLLQYRNSGSIPGIGDKSRVVGYWAISATEKNTIATD